MPKFNEPIPADWLEAVPALASEECTCVLTAVAEARRRADIFPPEGLVFNALAHSPLKSVKAVIIGQDPYHGPGQAHGLSFSVPDGMPAPRSLQNIFKEIKADIYGEEPFDTSPDLTRWADQGVLLLNTCLTVESGKANSHRRWGWENITDKIIQAVSDSSDACVFLLWGNHARAKSGLIDASRHLVLEAAHPSPLSASRGFFGCRHFSRANNWLEEQKISGIIW